MVQNEKNTTLNRNVMEFDSNKPIFLQIADSFHEKILSGELNPGDRIMSVRELGGELGVNPNTVMRSYEKMTASGIIYNKRGIGYFISLTQAFSTADRFRHAIWNTCGSTQLVKHKFFYIKASGSESPTPFLLCAHKRKGETILTPCTPFRGISLLPVAVPPGLGEA